MDMFMGVSTEKINGEVLLVEFKLNYLNNLRNVNSTEIKDKDLFSRQLLGGAIKINSKSIFIFSNQLIQQAINKFKRLYPKIPSAFKPMTLEDFKNTYF